jgi:hypothetical protein
LEEHLFSQSGTVIKINIGARKMQEISIFLTLFELSHPSRETKYLQFVTVKGGALPTHVTVLVLATVNCGFVLRRWFNNQFPLS